jgi:Xaa-Pro aminopeptidase
MADRCEALVATFDAPDLKRSERFTSVRTYREGPRAALLEMLADADPKRIGINVSTEDALADGLTAGLRDYLSEALGGTPFAGRLVSAEALVAALRGVKLPEELARIRGAVEETEAMFDRVGSSLKIGMTAKEVADRFHREAAAAGVQTAWPARHCPTVTIGSRAPIGHVSPGAEAIERDCLVHVDFGILRNGYCSDLQRVWYVAGEGAVPDPVLRAYAALVRAIEAAAKALRPGAVGWEVDEIARDVLRSGGYPEYAHALGHHLGRAVHDGAGVLGPRWERYGRAPYESARAGNVYTLEPSIALAGHGLVSLEEDVVVEPQGARFLSRFPRELPVLRLR